MKIETLKLVGFLVGVMLLLSIDVSRAQDAPEAKLNRDDLYESQIVSLRLYPAKESVPVFKHRLVKDPSGMLDRNAVIHYHRAIHFERRAQNSTDVDVEVFNEWAGATPSELPKEQVKRWLEENRLVFEELRKSRHCAEVDWGLQPTQYDESPWHTISIDEVQHIRQFARLALIKAKLEIAEGRLDDTIETIQTGYKLGMDVGKSGFLVGDLVGIASIGITNGALYELIQHPDAPSLYWALTELPQPMIDSRKTILHELSLSKEGFGLGMLTSPDEDWTPEQWKKQLFKDADFLFSTMRVEEPPGAGVHGTAAAMVLRGYPIARQGLIDSGLNERDIDVMPVLKALSLYEQQVVDKVMAEYRKMLMLPFREALEQSINLDRGSYEMSQFKKGASVLPFLDVFLPATTQVMSADLRIRNRMVSLRTIEAIRLHLGQTGELPASLDEIKIVPVPNNEYSGKPMYYSKTAQGATLIEFGRREFNAKIYDLTVGEIK